MQQRPQRPFVPHRTPTTPRPAITTSEFRLSAPFVPGKTREIAGPVETGDSTVVAESQSDSNALLRSIEDFLDASPSSPRDAQEIQDIADEGEFEEEPDELPPVEHFMDPLPAVDQFAPDAGQSIGENGADVGAERAAGGSTPIESAESGWIETDWQHYDWRAAAALGETGSEAASSAWATTDWDASAPKPRPLRQTAAHAIATALDEIAQRIRAGEIVVPGPGAAGDPAAIAASLAALLGGKR